MLGLVACKGAKSPSGGGSSEAATCGEIVNDLTAFSEDLENASADAKVRVASYAGVLELLLDFEGASSDLDGELASLKTSGDALGKTRASLARSIQFAKAARGEIEQHAKDIAPLAKETQQAWAALRAICEGKGKAPDCSGVRDAITKFDAAESSDGHDKAIAALGAVKVTTPALLKARDRATTASRAVQTALRSHEGRPEQMPKRWADVQKDLSGSVDGLVASCKDDARDPTTASLVTAPTPDPRKLTVLLHVKPTAGVEKGLLALAAASKDEDEKAFYRARAEGAFGSGFFLVKKDDKGNTDVLIVTNRHVIDLGDRAALELADGTSLGSADIVYADPSYDLAVLKPATRPALKDGGFAFAEAPAKDQQTVIATGFPGMIGATVVPDDEGLRVERELPPRRGRSASAHVRPAHRADRSGLERRPAHGREGPDPRREHAKGHGARGRRPCRAVEVRPRDAEPRERDPAREGCAPRVPRIHRGDWPFQTRGCSCSSR